MFIPRKIVKNGMMVWSMATYVAHPASNTSKLPYFVEFIPHLKLNDGGGATAVIKMLQRWRFTTMPHIVADSGFGSIPLLKQISDFGAVGTLSIPINEIDKLNYILSYNLPLNRWRTCVNSEGIICSIQCKMFDNVNGSSSIGKKYVISNAFNCEKLNFGTINIGDNNEGMYLYLL